MPVTTDMAMVGGCEMWGFPKEIVNILFPAPEDGDFDYNPRLVKTEVAIRPRLSQMADVEVKLKSSDTDPWV
jgi:hypothetical protein